MAIMMEMERAMERDGDGDGDLRIRDKLWVLKHSPYISSE